MHSYRPTSSLTRFTVNNISTYNITPMFCSPILISISIKRNFLQLNRYLSQRVLSSFVLLLSYRLKVDKKFMICILKTVIILYSNNFMKLSPESCCTDSVYKKWIPKVE